MSSRRTAISGSCSARRPRATCRAPRSSGRTGTTTVSRVGGAKWRPPASARAFPTLSPMRMPASPFSLPIRPAGTAETGTSPPSSKTVTAETLSSPSRPSGLRKRSTSRACTVPSTMRTYAVRSPFAVRSTLNTVPRAGASASPVAAGSRPVMPSARASMPAPVAAEPKKTGWTRHRTVCSARACRSRAWVRAAGSSTYAVSSSSSWRVSRSMSAPVKPGSDPVNGVVEADRVPRCRVVPMATMSGESRSAMLVSSEPYRAPGRSVLLTNSRVGMRNRRRVRRSTRVWAWTPSTAETTRTAPSSTPRTRSTSAMKSGWPGVSIRLTVVAPRVKETTADLMVMPRWRSSARESVRVLPWSTLPMVSMVPAVWRSRSVRLVLPASTCARIPRFTVCTKLHVLERKVSFCREGHESSAHNHKLLGRPDGLRGVDQGALEGRNRFS